MAQDWVYGESVVAFHEAVQSAPTGVGSSAGGEDAPPGFDEAALLKSVVANTVAATKGRMARSLIVPSVLQSAARRS